MDFADIDKQLQAMESDSIVQAAKAAKQTCQCANLAERWLCRDCGECWFGSLSRAGCPNCGANAERIDMRNDLTGDVHGMQYVGMMMQAIAERKRKTIHAPKHPKRN